MTIALRLPDGRHLLPAPPTGWTVTESPLVHVTGERVVVLEPDTNEFTVEGPPLRERSTVFRGYERIVPVDELPKQVPDEETMAKLRAEWENVDALYRKVEDVLDSVTPQSRTVSLTDYRVVEVSSDPSTAVVPPVTWTVDSDYLGVRGPLAALVPGVLSGVPEMVLAQLEDRLGKRHFMGAGVSWTLDDNRFRPAASITGKFDLEYADDRTKWVKKDPSNNRRNAKRIEVPDTRRIVYTTEVPRTVAVGSYADAMDAVRNLIDTIAKGYTEDPTRICATCHGEGFTLAPHVKREVRQR